MAGKATRAGQRKDVKAEGKDEQRKAGSEKHVCSRTDLEGRRGGGGGRDETCCQLVKQVM